MDPNDDGNEVCSAYQGWRMSGSSAARKFFLKLLAGNILYFAGNFSIHNLLLIVLAL